METPKERIELDALVAEFVAGIDGELRARLDAWTPDFAHIHVNEVVGGLLARQATLVKGIAGASEIWNENIAPILLRAMADVYINIAWILLNPAERSLKFISFGLGQAKLELEHHRSKIVGRPATEREKALIADMEWWIDRQRSRFLQDVDLGKWAGLSVRQMAHEANCMDFYNFVYTPFSACAHSMWHHIARCDLVTCANPLHRYHLRPSSRSVEPDIHYLILAAKYWANTLGAFDEQTGVLVPCPSSYQSLVDVMEGFEG